MNAWLAASLGGLAALGFSARYNWWRRPLTGLPVLMYHHVTDDLNGSPLPKLRVKVRRFARQLDCLAAQGLQTLTLSQAVSAEPGAKGVVITFDDGYLDFYEQAWPLLRQRGMTATVFLVTGVQHNAWDAGKGEPEEPLMTREQILELDALGVEFGGHTHTHQDLRKLEPRKLLREITGCQKALTDLLGRPARSFSYPYGLFSERVQEAVKEAGFTAACTTKPGLLGPQTPALAVPRIIVKRSDDGLDFRLKLSRARSRF